MSLADGMAWEKEYNHHKRVKPISIENFKGFEREVLLAYQNGVTLNCIYRANTDDIIHRLTSNTGMYEFNQLQVAIDKFNEELLK